MIFALLSDCPPFTLKFNHSEYKVEVTLLWVFFNKSGFIKWVQLSYEHNQLTHELEKIQLEQKELTTHLDKLENDIDYIEFLAYS